MGTNKMDFEGSGHGLASGLKCIQNFIARTANGVCMRETGMGLCMVVAIMKKCELGWVF